MNEYGYIACLMRNWKSVSPKAKIKTETNPCRPLEIRLPLFAHLHLILNIIAFFFILTFSSNTVFKTETVVFSKLCQRHPEPGYPTATLLYVFKCIYKFHDFPLCVCWLLSHTSQKYEECTCVSKGKLATCHPCDGRRWWPGRAVASEEGPDSLEDDGHCRVHTPLRSGACVEEEVSFFPPTCFQLV